MGPRQAKKFFEENREVLNLLAEKLKQFESVRFKSPYTPAERAAAIEIVEGWIQEVWGISRENFHLYSDGEDNLIRRLENEEQSSFSE
jgi:hypothetical protein